LIAFKYRDYFAGSGLAESLVFTATEINYGKEQSVTGKIFRTKKIPPEEGGMSIFSEINYFFLMFSSTFLDWSALYFV